MRLITFLTAVALTGCAAPSYVMRSSDINLAAAPAVREENGQPVVLKGGSFMPTPDPPLPGGLVRVRGTSRHGAIWKAGVVITIIGIPLAITGAALGITGFKDSLVCFAVDSPDCAQQPANMAKNQDGNRKFVAGLTIGVIGDVMGLALGPGLWISGAQPAAIELRY